MVKIAQLGSYDANIGDNIAMFNIRRVLNNIVDEPIEWTNLNIKIPHDKNNDVDASKVLFDDISTKYDMLIVGGGGLIEGDAAAWNGKTKYGTHWKLPFDEKILDSIKIPIVCFALGVNYFRSYPRISKSGQENIKRLVDQSALFSLRNDGSVDLFRQFSDQDVYEVPDAGLVFDHHFQAPRRTKIEDGALQTAWNYSLSQMNGRWRSDENNPFVIANIATRHDLTHFPHTMKDYQFPHILHQTEFSFSHDAFQDLIKFGHEPLSRVFSAYSTFDYAVALRGHGQMVAIGINLPSIYFSTQDKVRDFSYRNGFADYNVDIYDDEWESKLEEKIVRMKTDKEYLENWYEIRDKAVVQYTKDFYDFCHKIKDLL